MAKYFDVMNSCGQSYIKFTAVIYRCIKLNKLAVKALHRGLNVMARETYFSAAISYNI